MISITDPHYCIEHEQNGSESLNYIITEIIQEASCMAFLSKFSNTSVTRNAMLWSVHESEYAQQYRRNDTR